MYPREMKARVYVKAYTWSSRCAAVETNPSSVHEDVDLTPGLAQWVRDPELLWYRPAAVALI